MKFAKKLFALLLATLMMVGLLSTTAMADGYTITVNNSVEGHTYTAYQIFTGDLEVSTGVLTNIKWGANINADALVSELKKDSTAGTAYPLFSIDGVNPFAAIPAYDSSNPDASANAVAKAISGWPYYEANIMKFADVASKFLNGTGSNSNSTVAGKYVMSVDKTGYYLIKDTGALSTDGATDYMLLINIPDSQNNTNITPKVSAPTFNKTVHHTLEGTYGKFLDSEISDAANDDIKTGEEVDLSKLAALGTSNAVWFKLEATLPSLFKNYHQYHLKFTDELPATLKPVPGSSKGNIYLLHESGEKKFLDAEISIAEKSDGGTLTGYIITLDFHDIKTQLTGVNFNLNDTIVIKYAATLEPGADLGTASGNMSTATMTYSNDMNQAFDADHGPNSSHDGLKTGTLSSFVNVYTYQATFTKVDSATKAPLGGAEFYLFRNRTINQGTKDYYAVVNSDGYVTDWTINKTDATKLVSGTDGKFVVKGLDALSYYLEEYKAPSGYDKMKESVLFTISAPVENQQLTGLSMTVDAITVQGDLSAGTVTGQVNNTAGKVLPATGGIGTTIFYIVGGVLVMGAGAAFVMKRRNEA
ncbi:MAG: isopeptide-forming domain-containing fimbrial protein [Oscillospiraceae bacterium]|nr:isopeptide-forming domain-containing fimbrial protein [Oscillospiraceae bacterium]